MISAAFKPKERAIIFEAMEIFRKFSCVKWVPKESKNEKHGHYVHITKGPGCASAVGRQLKGGQALTLRKLSFNLVGSVQLSQELISSIKSFGSRPVIC